MWLKAKYLAYNGDINIGHMKALGVQYGHPRTGNGNGKRAGRMPRPSNRFTGNNLPPKVMVVDGLTGHRVMRTEAEGHEVVK